MPLTQDQKQRFYMAAKAKGIDDTSIQREIMRKDQELSVPAPQPQPEIAPEPGMTEKVGNAILGVGKQLLQPFVNTGKRVGAAGFEVARAGSAALGNKNAYTNQDTGETVANPFMSEEELATASKPITDKDSMIRKQVGDSAQIGAYAIPFGKGANFVTRATLPGMASGAMFEGGRELSQGEDLNAGKIVGSAAIGGATATAVYGAGKALRAIKNRAGSTEPTQPRVTADKADGEKALQEVSHELGGEKQAKRAAEDFLADNYIIPAKRAQKLKPYEVAKEILQDGYKDGGDFEALREAGNNITGDKGAATKIMREAVGGIEGEVNLAGKDGGNTVLTSVKNLLKTSHDIPKPVKDDVMLELTDMIGGLQTGSLPDKVNPFDAFELGRQLQKMAVASDAKSTYLTRNLQAEAIADIYRAAADELMTVVEKSALDQGSLAAAKTPELIAQLAEYSPRTAQKVLNAQTIAELRSAVRPWVRLNEMMDLTEAARQTAFSKVARGLTSPAADVGGAVAGMPGRLAGKGVDVVAGSKIARTVGNAVEDAGQAIKPGFQAAGNAAGAVVGGAEKTINNPMFSAAVVPNIAAAKGQEAAQPTETTPSFSGNAPMFDQGQSQPTPTLSGYQPEQLRQAYQEAVQNGWTQDAKTLKKMIDDDAAYAKTNTAKPVSAATARIQGQAKNGMRGIEEVRRMLQKDPSILAKSFLTKNLATRQYQNAAFRAAEGILRINTGAQVNKQEIEAYAKQLMPWFGDSREVALYKLKQLEQDYENLGNILNAQDTEYQAFQDPNQPVFYGQ